MAMRSSASSSARRIVGGISKIEGIVVRDGGSSRVEGLEEMCADNMHMAIVENTNSDMSAIFSRYRVNVSLHAAATLDCPFIAMFDAFVAVVVKDEEDEDDMELAASSRKML